MSTTPEDTKAILATLFKPEQAKKVVEALSIPKKPAGWSRHSRATYYGEVYARQIKAIFDGIADDRQDRIFFYASLPQFSAQTIYTRINQSIRYLVDVLDEDGTYRKLRGIIDIHRDRVRKGLRFELRKEFRENLESSSFKPVEMIPTIEMPKWKQKIETWLEKSEPGQKPFTLERLALTPDEIKELKEQFMGLTNVISYVAATEIKLVKVNQ